MQQNILMTYLTCVNKSNLPSLCIYIREKTGQLKPNLIRLSKNPVGYYHFKMLRHASALYKNSVGQLQQLAISPQSRHRAIVQVRTVASEKFKSLE
jgi:hypothetical protein